MIKFSAVSLLTYLLVCGCKTAAPTSAENAVNALDSRSIEMKIVCNANYILKQDVLFQLRQHQAVDVVARDFMEEVEIQAAFPLSRTALATVQDLQTDLKTKPGVISVDLNWSKVPAAGNLLLTDGTGRLLSAH
jgi:hypothetical protein